MKEKIFSKWGIAISLTVIYVLVFLLAVQFNVVSFVRFSGEGKTYSSCGDGTCTLRTNTKGAKFCSCEGKPGRAKIDCCEQAAQQQPTAPAASTEAPAQPESK